MTELERNISHFLHTLFYSTNMHDLIEAGAKILQNPISIYNTAYSCIGLSSKDGIEDDLWQQGKIGENTQYRYASYLHYLEQKYYKNPIKYKYFYETWDVFGTHRRRMILLVFESVVIGYMNILEYHKSLDDIPDEHYELVVGAITKAVSIAISRDYNHITTAEALLYDILTESYSNKEIFLQRVQGTRFERASNYRLCAINIQDIARKGTIIGNMKLQLLSIFSEAWSVLIDQYAILLVDCGKTENIPLDGIERLKIMLADWGLQMGVSDCYHDLFASKAYLFQARKTADVLKKTLISNTVGMFDDYRLWCCADLIQKDYSDIFVSESVKKMLDFDRQNGTEYAKTLFYYLDCKKSLKETAIKLHVHRNTVYYRIGRMKELFGVSEAEGYHDYQNYFGCLLTMLSDEKEPERL